jgi:hypothetical protein
LKKYVLIAALIILIVIFFIIYKYRAQDLGDVINIEQVERIHLSLDDRKLDGVKLEIPRVSKEQINQLANFLNQYQVKLTNKKGWISDYPSEQFTLRIVYKNGDFEIYTIERDTVASTRIYEVVNAPLDYKWIKEFERELNSN